MSLVTMDMFLCHDICKVDNNDARIDNSTSSMLEDDIRNYSMFWIDTLYKIVIVFTASKCTRRTNVVATKKAI